MSVWIFPDADNPHSTQAVQVAVNKAFGGSVVGWTTEDTIELDSRTYTYEQIGEEFGRAVKYWRGNYNRYAVEEDLIEKKDTQVRSRNGQVATMKRARYS